MAFTRVSAPVEVEGLHGLTAWLGDLSSEDVYVLSEDGIRMANPFRPAA